MVFVVWVGVAMRTVELIRVLVAVSMLLAGVPAWRHSHTAGDRPHHHEHGDDHAHDHDGMTESLAHAHVMLFGVEFTLPVESDDDDSEEGQTTFLVAAPAVVDAVQASHCAALAQPMLDVGEPVQIVPRFCCLTASAAPLCDTARHERSGVLLI